MTIAEEIGFVDLSAVGNNENENTAVARLCIPALTLQDGPNGVAYGDTGVTQLPASIATAATFDPTLADAYGKVLGSEARAQGIDVIQGPNLNLARVPQAGRLFETYGEDPTLASAMGVAEIKGIQSVGELDDAKHYTGYTEETSRFTLNQIISTRALEEDYLAPFRAAVDSAHAASVMCAYGEINGTNTCSDPNILQVLNTDPTFTGFIRSDLGAVPNPVTAFRAGMDMIKPAAPKALRAGLADGKLSRARLDDAVERILTQMFAFRLITHPPTGKVDTPVASPAHEAVALADADRSIVLLKDQAHVLPLDASSLSSVAVIGTDASSSAMTAGGGSANVVAPFVDAPASAIAGLLGGSSRVTYVPASSANPVQTLFVATPAPSSSTGGTTTTSTTSTTTSTTLAPAGTTPTAGPVSVPATASPADETATSPGSGPGWNVTTSTFTPSASGHYELAISTDGDSWLQMDGSTILAAEGLGGRWTTSTTVELNGGQTYTFRLDYFLAKGSTTPAVTVQDVDDALTSAVQAASASQYAVVFVNDQESEGEDRQNLELPGYQNALIAAVAAVNSRTVVVLNTGGPVTMPWLGSVAGVLEAWYPGEVDGLAIASVLFGRVDPSGRLPVTFPVSEQQTPTSSPAQWPGVDDVVHFSEGLDLGYRGYDARHLPALFPFGFGLSYTHFALSALTVATNSSGALATVRVRNTGSVAGREVVEAYLVYPSAAAEPPRQLRAFATVSLAAGASATVDLSIPLSGFEAYLGGRFTTVPGRYTLLVGESSNALPLRASLSAPGT